MLISLESSNFEKSFALNLVLMRKGLLSNVLGSYKDLGKIKFLSIYNSLALASLECINGLISLSNTSSVLGQVFLHGALNSKVSTLGVVLLLNKKLACLIILSGN